MPLRLSSQMRNETDLCFLPGATVRVYSNAYKALIRTVATSETHRSVWFASAGFIMAIISLSTLFLTLQGDWASNSDLYASPLRTW